MRPIFLSFLALTLVACGDDDDPRDPMVPPPNTNAQFTLRIENISDRSALPTPFAPVAWAVANDNPLFVAGAMADMSALETLAEDGDPSGLVAGLPAGTTGGALDTPLGASGPGPIMPGQVYEGTFTVASGQGGLTLASMLVQSNDLFIAPSAPIPLFDSNGPLGERDVTSQLRLWDAGTERNQAPGAGPDQAPRQAGANVGPAEGVIASFRDSTRALPVGGSVAAVSVSESGGTFEITLTNRSDAGGAMLTPVGPVFWATHDDSWSLFEEGGSATAGLEELAEDGSPAGLVAEHSSAGGVGVAGAQPITVERPSDPAGPAMPGERFRFSVTPDSTYRYLSFATMLVESNDAFLALPFGVELIDGAGSVRSAAAVETDIGRWLAVWDAGTEANEVPGAGLYQAPRQVAPDSGPVDADDTVRRYQDATNDLAENLATLFDVFVESSSVSGSFDVTVTNNSDLGAYPTPLTPVAWALHSDDYQLFTMGAPASTAIERLAEDGDPSALADVLSMQSEVGSSGVEATPVGAGGPGPLVPGDSYTFTVTPSSTERFFSFATMVVQSNDTFLSVLPGGVALLDELGNPRADMAIASDLASALAAFDAGTEGNQIGAAGADQALKQSMPNVGPAEGSATVRLYDDPVWSYPSLDALVRVTVAPAE